MKMLLAGWIRIISTKEHNEIGNIRCVEYEKGKYLYRHFEK